MQYSILNDKKRISSIIDYLIDKENLSKIQRRLIIYVENDAFQIEILNNKVSYRKNSRLKTIYLKTKKLKYFF